MRLKLGQGKTGSQQKKGAGAKGSPRGGRSSLLSFLFFLFISFAFWFVQSMQGDFTRKVYIPVVYDSIPSDLVPSSELPRYIVVQVEDTGFEQITYSIYGLSAIRVGREGIQADPVLLMGSKELHDQVVARLSPTAYIGDMSPQEIRIPLLRRASKRLPIVAEFLPFPAPGYMAYPPVFTPDSITVYGSADLLAGLEYIATEDLEVEELKHTLTSKLQLELPSGVISEHMQVQMHIDVEEYTEHLFTLPISVSGAGRGYRLLPLPSVAQLRITIPRSRYNELVDTDFELSVAFPRLEGEHTTNKPLEVRLSKHPDWVKHYRIEPQAVQYVIERTTPAY